MRASAPGSGLASLMGTPEHSTAGLAPGIVAVSLSAGPVDVATDKARRRRRRRQACIGVVLATDLCLGGPATAKDLRAAAAALAMSAFVVHYCPNLKPNDQAIYDVFKKAGFDTPDPPQLLISEAGSIQADLKRMPAERACSQLWDHFGAVGSSVPGLLEATRAP